MENKHSFACHAFETYWSLILLVWEHHQHCMIRGCGRDTFHSYIRRILKDIGFELHYTNDNFWRRVLMEGVRRGVCTKHSQCLVIHNSTY